MVKSGLLLKLGLLIVFMTALTVYGAYHCKIVDGPYDKLTISNIDGIIHVIEDKGEIEKILSKINEGKRSFNYNDGFTYDSLPHGILNFENEAEKVQIGYIVTTGNTVTKFWEIETDFLFETLPNATSKKE
ncbi:MULTISPECIES: hypothetical protein [unclassified Mesobacillus]|uniref:hypothetical protein n=1 Tax=unclassified Mesobacillus TaxID=2675270 RepID=UPI00203D36CF|nr:MULTISPECIES: hypothetical protein [unclassified Mesobacillus]MCM3125107.1 hypothetical protein [Mesobacillus sp. MER 33]MCM3235133.1 hypothetical protein [Mesobacillus sp. MER 48]